VVLGKQTCIAFYNTVYNYHQ